MSLDGYYEGLEQDLAAVRERNYLTVGALAVLVAQSLFSFDDEYRLIWKKPISLIKWIHIFLRYFALTFQSGNLYMMLDRLSIPPLSHDTCRTWVLSMSIASLLVISAIDVVLMLRVYALYMKSTLIGVMMIILFVIGVGVDMVLTLELHTMYTTKFHTTIFAI
ncbi:hypothetical protein BDQ17DRAFT_1355757 [Cyathus striatus]|nr:hypothetical protein BDQ17DRAFT_1355757 [Cyathus striatus]